ncbi:MAG: hypothetical protein V1902_01305 [Candidatus Falkowbacteria bacterium]
MEYFDKIVEMKKRILSFALLLLIFCCLFGLVSAAAPNPGHTWSELGDVAVTVAQGGTGQSSLTASNVILGNDTSAVQFVAPSTSGNVLRSDGSTWTSGTPAGRDIFAARTVSAPTADTFCHLVGNSVCSATGGTAMALRVPFNGTIKNLRTYMATAPAAGSNSLVFTAQQATGCNDSWSSTALTCTIAGDGSTVTCTDTAHSVSVTAGDCLRILLDVTGSVTGSDSWSIEYDY